MLDESGADMLKSACPNNPAALKTISAQAMSSGVKGTCSKSKEMWSKPACPISSTIAVDGKVKLQP